MDLTIAKTFTCAASSSRCVWSRSMRSTGGNTTTRSNITAANFGRITGVSATRTGQIGLRLTF